MLLIHVHESYVQKPEDFRRIAHVIHRAAPIVQAESQIGSEGQRRKSVDPSARPVFSCEDEADEGLQMRAVLGGFSCWQPLC